MLFVLVVIILVVGSGARGAGKSKEGVEVRHG